VSVDVIDDEEGTRRGRGGSAGQGRRNRHRPFVSLLLVGLFAVPALAFVFRLIAVFSPGTLWLSTWLTLVAFALVLPLVSLFVGHRVTHRLPGVVWHVFVTLVIFGSWLSFTVQVSQDRREDAWWWRLWDAIALPGTWWVPHIVGALCLSGSWMIYRIDAFRTALGAGKSSNPLEAIFGKGVTARIEEAKVTDTAVEVILDHPGVPQSQVQAGLAKVNELPQFVPGKSTVIRDGEHGGRSVLRAAHTDAFSSGRWDPWPGLSAIGETYEHPINTAKYEGGAKQWFSFAKTPEGVRFAKAPEFASQGATFLGRQGMTGAGKSGDACIEEAEIASRRDVVLVHVAPAKLKQNIGWLLEAGGVRLVADGPRAALLFRALRALGNFRDTVDLGRDFSSEVAAKTGRPWVHIFADEFDYVKQGDDLKWLLTKGRSLGFRFSFTLPRASGDNFDTNLRSAIGAWKQFGLTQDYDAAFVLSKETRDAGATQHESWAAAVPGAQYLDGAPGVSRALYPMAARTYRTREDYADLKAAVIEARQMFEPMDFPDDEKEVLGQVLDLCDPARELQATYSPEDFAAQPTTSDDAPPPLFAKGMNMQETLNMGDLPDPMTTGDADLDAELAAAPPLDLGPLRSMVGDIDIRRPVPIPEPMPGAKMDEIPGLKPKGSPQETRAEFDAACVRLLDKSGRRSLEIGNKDIMAEMQLQMAAGSVSEHLRKLLDGEDHIHQPAPGATMQRAPQGRGRYVITRL
jgi:hypothetical protein